MKIAILSDTHDNLATLKKALVWIGDAGIDAVIHCGDVCGVESLEFIFDNFTGKIYLVLGNGDYRSSVLAAKNKGMFLDVVFCGEFGELEIGNKKIAFTHQLNFVELRNWAVKYDYIFYGHTHKPWKEKMGKCQIINPGNLAGISYSATFAVFDSESGKLELKILGRM